MPRLLPLYQQAHTVKFAELDSPHAGLWFEKFFSDFESDYKGKQKQPQMYQDIVKPLAQPDQRILENYLNRHIQLVKSQNGQTRVFENAWHFVTGMGQEHPIENGFSFHPLLGCPYLAGSAIKGLLRHWMTFYLEADDKVLDWFGSKDDQNPKVGSLIFFDALPTKRPSLLVDIMTPHYGDWYLKGGCGEQAPDDAQEPNPIPFLVVDKKASFAFSIASRKAEKSAQEDIEEAFVELASALELLGAGAKTATGYGRFIENKKEKKKAIATSQAQSTVTKETEEFLKIIVLQGQIDPNNKTFIKNVAKELNQLYSHFKDKPLSQPIIYEFNNTIKIFEPLDKSAINKALKKIKRDILKG